MEKPHLTVSERQVVLALLSRASQKREVITGKNKLHSVGAIVLPAQERSAERKKCLELVEYYAFANGYDIFVLGKTAKDGSVGHEVRVVDGKADIGNLAAALREAERRQRRITLTPAHARESRAEGRPKSGGYSVWFLDSKTRHISARGNREWQTALSLDQIAQAVQVGLGDTRAHNIKRDAQRTLLRRQHELTA